MSFYQERLYREREYWISNCAKLINETNQYITERDTLIDDLPVLKANISRLEQIRDIKDSALKGADIKIKTLERENEKLIDKLEGAETYIDAIKTYYPMYESLRKQYNTLTNHIRMKAEANPSVDRYKDLVKVIDRLEQK